jgi:zinc transporter ZupT
VIGAVADARWSLPKRVTGVLLAFASGALISALAFELFEEAFALVGAVHAGLACWPVPPPCGSSRNVARVTIGQTQPFAVEEQKTVLRGHLANVRCGDGQE